MLHERLVLQEERHLRAVAQAEAPKWKMVRCRCPEQGARLPARKNRAIGRCEPCVDGATTDFSVGDHAVPLPVRQAEHQVV